MNFLTTPSQFRILRTVVLLLSILAFVHVRATSAATDPLEEGFAHPSRDSRPWVYWFWVDGNVSREGITADLESMARVGIGGVLLMDVAQDLPEGPVRFGSVEWRALFKHAVLEATRLGIRVSLHNSAGWTGSGGPWITPGLGMQKLVFSQTNLVGPGVFSGRLPDLAKTSPRPQTFAVVAFPSPPGEGAPLTHFSPKVTSNDRHSFNPANLLDNNPNSATTVPVPRFRGSPYIQLEFERPYAASHLLLASPTAQQGFQGVLEVSENGRNFRVVREFLGKGGLKLSFGMVSARFYRVRFTRVDQGLHELRFSELELAPIYRIEDYLTKTGLGRAQEDSKKHATDREPQSTGKTEPATPIPDSAALPAVSITNLTQRLREDGSLEWEVPAGNWTVLRAGYMPTETLNHPARQGGGGLECDKLSKDAIEKHFESFLLPLIKDVQAAGGTALSGLHIDSWEVGFQNWTATFANEFQNRRGYDPVPYLPACTGRIVGNLEISERFLWDMRRTIADLVADNYAGHLASLSHARGLELSIEAYGNGPFDDLLYASRADIPMTEFWISKDPLDMKAMPSAAHTLGRKIVAAEAFTSYPENAKWQNHPFLLKPLADAAFCEGVNRLVIHRFAHQPWTNRAPGITTGPWGTHYERTVTWWEQSKPWHDYLTRCQSLLQSGTFVADICYLTDEGAFNRPPGKSQLEPPLPKGFNYDLATPEMVLNKMTVQEGRLAIPGGTEYRVLVLPPERAMTPHLLRKLAGLVREGATIVGAPRTKSPSLAGYPECDKEVQQIAGELWGDCDGKTVTEHAFGKGRVFWGKPLPAVLQALGQAPDFVEIASTQSLRWIHRQVDSADLYFVASPGSNFVTADCEFRVADRAPELWHPDSGKIESAPVWQAAGDHTRVRLNLDPSGSVFVAFRSAKSTNALPRTFAGRKSRQVTGEWEITFPPNLGAPEMIRITSLKSWTEQKQPGVKYFSGTATYHKTIEIPGEWFSNANQVQLNLGTVQVIAEVEVNGRNLGVLWKPPFQVDITSAAKPGPNELAIKVTNLWPNRLIGDEQLPDDTIWRASQPGFGLMPAGWSRWLVDGRPSPTGRIAFAAWKHWTKDSPLLPSGLLGPVTIECLKEK